MSQPIFRQKSMEKISSPEQMNDYIRVSNPSVWMILAAVIVLLAGVCVWGMFGCLEYYILEAQNIAEAITLIEKYKLKLSVVLLNIVVFEIDGFKVLSYLKNNLLIDRSEERR